MKQDAAQKRKHLKGWTLANPDSPEWFDDYFWQRVWPEPNTGCWIWGSTWDKHGYAKAHVVVDGKEKQVAAYRMSYEHFIGPIPPGLVPDHLCRTHACVNPDHLEPVTNRENVARGVSPVAMKMKQTTCKRGHQFDGLKPSYGKNRPFRHCTTCQRISTQISQEKRRQRKRELQMLQAS